MTSTEPEDDDPFNTLLTLEDSLYTSAHTLGLQDGARAGKIEGRVFGLERGFDKFAALGVLHGRSVVWSARARSISTTSPSTEGRTEEQSTTIAPREGLSSIEAKSASKANELEIRTLPSLPQNPSSRLQKHISTLSALTEPATFSTLNTEDAVADFDDRFKRASAKAKMIERILGEGDVGGTGDLAQAKGVPRSGGEGKGKSDEIEGFTGSRFIRDG